MSKYFSLFWLTGLLTFNVHAADIQDPRVALIEDESSECLSNDGKLILLQINADKPLVVWLDRWFMGVQTADHTKHVLQPGQEPIALGCSKTRDKDQQVWTIASVQEQ
ncbi:hypothetical protein LG201_00030 [Methylobacillus gramineus]|uniref:hypothetical protein n=1 Tax=Methylobacillus gramineus TaxID=755169 RepID=UPI001CFF80FC|nr:hypothetical protein [Methylobacillus gramineus]MCB5183592.1 hypothetical protein [Methylobacillus gramineus]